MSRIIVVGGGISGLTLAYRLEQRLAGAEVLVLEERSRSGGVIDTLEREGFRVETGPNGFLDNNPATLELCREIGLADRLIPASDAASRNRYLLVEGRLRRLPGSLLSFLSTDLISWVGKVELLTERFRARRQAFADESVDAFFRRRLGRELAALGDAFVTGIYAGDPRLLSAAACFPRLVGYEREHGSLTAGFAEARRRRPPPPDAGAGKAPRGSRMWSFPGGLRLLTDRLAGRLRQPPRTGVRVERLIPGANGWTVSAPGQPPWEADAVILTAPAYRQAELLAATDPELAAKVRGVAYNRIAVVALGYRTGDVPHRLDGFGYLSPQREGRDVLGVQWCSSIFPGRAPEGTVLVRALCGGWRRGDLVDWPDDRLLAAVQAEMVRVLGVRADPCFRQVVCWHRAIPQYFLGHLEMVSWVEQRLGRHPGLYLGGSAYRGVAINDCVEQGGRLAARVAEGLRARQGV